MADVTGRFGLKETYRVRKVAESNITLIERVVRERSKRLFY